MALFSKLYKTAGITIQVDSDLPITKNTFHLKFKQFETDKPDKDNKIIIHHHFDQHNHSKLNNKKSVYLKPPWEIFEIDDYLVYKWIYPRQSIPTIPRIAYADIRHRKIDIYNDEFIKKQYVRGNVEFLSMFPTDQIILGAALAYFNGCIIHSSGLEIDGDGYLFIGHSGAGKSTIASLISNKVKSAKILCEDRNILRKINNQFFISSAWSHNDPKKLSSAVPQIRSIFFIRQSKKNHLNRITNKAKLVLRLLEYIIKPYTNIMWWDEILDLIEQIIDTVPCWDLEFNKTGDIAEKVIHSDFH